MEDNPIRILLIEDNLGDARLLTHMLADIQVSHFEVTRMERLGPALQRLKEETFDVILLDLLLPDVQGFDTFVEAQAQSTQVPIIVLTGLDDRALALKAVRQGAQDYLVKGQFDDNLLGRSIRYAIERKRAEEQLQASLRQKDVLLQEIHHRVKNNLQIISSLLELQSALLQDPAMLQMFRDAQSRVRAMALIHESLYRAPDLASIQAGEYIKELVEHLFRVYGNNLQPVTPRCKIDQVELDIDTAIPCGLIITELVSNALKYAFPLNEPSFAVGDKKREIRVGLQEKDGHLGLSVADSGVGLPSDLDWQNPDSLGLQLVHLLTGQLGGQIELDQSTGTIVYIRFAHGQHPYFRERKCGQETDPDR